MTSEELDRRVGLDGSDGVVYRAKSAAAGSGTSDVVAKNDKYVDRSRGVRGNGVNEPLLLDHDGSFGYNGSVDVAGEIVENTKSHDPKTHWSGEIPV